MKSIISTAIAAASAATLGFAAPAYADDHMDKSDSDANWKAQSPEIVERNQRGRVTKVRIDGKVYDVCMTQSQDACIQPRAAGLGFGDRPLMYWPGQPASSM